ncbi:MAG: leucine-rich repeat domain-containing protein [Prevotella sp.]|nr:leucine-rich repeat domain-containing protein [Prevotella sp.]
MRRFLSLALLALFCLFSNVVHAATVSEVIDGIAYNLDNSAYTATVMKQLTNGGQSTGDVVIPATVTGSDGYEYTIISMPATAFQGTGITSIDVQAAVAISYSSTYGGSFQKCTSLVSAKFAEGCTFSSSDQNIFYGCTSLEFVQLPSTCKNIATNFFYNCTSLSTLVCYAETPPTINNANAFYSIPSTCILYVPEASLTAYQESDWATYFTDIRAIESIETKDVGDIVYDDNGVAYVVTSVDPAELSVAAQSSNDGVTTGDVTISDKFYSGFTYYTVTGMADSAFKGTSVTSVSIPETVTTYGTETFENCTSLSSIELPEGCTSVTASMFSGCTALATVTLPSTIESIADGAFAGCTALTSITCNAVTPPTGTYSSAFENVTKDNVTLYVPEESVDTYKESELWSNFTAKINVNVGDIIYDSNGVAYSVTSISPNEVSVAAQSSNEGVTTGEVVIPETITYDGTEYTVTGTIKSAFSGSAITSVSLPGTITTWGTYEFQNCKSLTSAEISEGCTNLPTYMFYGCESLETVTLPSTVTSYGTYIFYNCSSLKSIKIPEGCTSLPNYMFAGCSALETVTLPSTVTTYGTYEFRDCTSLKSIEIPEGCTSLPNYMFNGCSALENVTLPSTITTYGTYLFQNCTKLASIEIPSSVTSIGDYAFAYSGLKTLTVPSTVTSWGKYAFAYCDSLKSIEIPEGCTSLTGTYMFANCSSLETATLPSTLTTYGTYMFQNCTSLKSIEIPEGCTTLTIYMFDGCTSLETISLPSTLTSVINYSFRNCTSLTTIICNAVEPPTGTYSKAFGSVTGSNVTAYVPATSVSAYKEDDLWSNFNIEALAEVSLSEGDIIYDEQGLAYEITSTEEDNLTVTLLRQSTNDGVTEGDIVVPVSVTAEDGNAYAVTALADSVFYNGTYTSVVFEDGIAVTAIPAHAFDGCNSLTRLTIPEGVTSLGDYAIVSTSIKTIILPATLESVGSYAMNCKNLVDLICSAVTAPTRGDYTFGSSGYFGPAFTLWVPCGASDYAGWYNSYSNNSWNATKSTYGCNDEPGTLLGTLQVGTEDDKATSSYVSGELAANTTYYFVYKPAEGGTLSISGDWNFTCTLSSDITSEITGTEENDTISYSVTGGKTYYLSFTTGEDSAGSYTAWLVEGVTLELVSPEYSSIEAESWESGSEIVVKSNTKGYLTYTIDNITTSENLYTGYFPDPEEVDGEYVYTTTCPKTFYFYADNTYTFTANLKENDHYEATVWKSETFITFTGLKGNTTSTVTIVSCSPDPDDDNITFTDGKDGVITITFSDYVKLDEDGCYITLGLTGTDTLEDIEGVDGTDDGNGYYTQWAITISASKIKSYVNEGIVIVIAGEDASGNTLFGDADDGDAYTTLTFIYSLVTEEEITLVFDPENGSTVTSLSTIIVTAENGSVAYASDESSFEIYKDGELTGYELYLSDDNEPGTGRESDVDSTETETSGLVFCIADPDDIIDEENNVYNWNAEITADGTYTITFPAGTFSVDRNVYDEETVLTYTIDSTASGEGEGDENGNGSGEGDENGGTETGISAVQAAIAGGAEVYTISGQKVSAPVNGVNIVKYADGTVKKILQK